jgi:hypothetical protein
MSRLFPALDRKLVRHILRNGVRVGTADELAFEVALTLESIGLINITRRRFWRCAYRNDPDYLERLDRECEGIIEVDDPNKAYFCPECGQPIENAIEKTIFEDIQVSLDPNGITQYVSEAIEALELVASVEPLAQGAFLVSVADGRSLKLVVLDYAEAQYRFAGFYFAEPSLQVVVSPINEPVKHVLEEQVYIQLWDLLSQDALWLAEKVNVAAYPVPGRMELASVEQRFDDMLAKDNGWQYFEQQFVPALYAHVCENPKLVEDYLGQLKRISDTVLNFFAVPIGGAGRTDLRSINKFEMMNEVFAGDAIADAKRFVQSTLEQNHISKILLHLMTDPQKPSRAIVFLSTNQVRSSAWEVVMQLKNNEGYWKIIVLTKYMILELLAQLDALDLLDAD